MVLLKSPRTNKGFRGDILEIKLRDQYGGKVFFKDKCGLNDKKRLIRILRNIEEIMNVNIVKALNNGEGLEETKESDWFG